MNEPHYGQAFARWRAAAGGGGPGPWQAYTRHAFVNQLGDGSLPRTSFLNYLQQDYVFLIHFSRAWALAVVKAETLDEMRAAAATVHALTHIEMPLHVQLCAAEGITAATLELTPEAPENLAYTRYVLEAGYSGDLLDLLAALAPCVLGYGEIGARLKGTETPYRHWVETYGGEPYQALCRDVGSLMDRAIERRLGADWEAVPRWRSLCERFTTATRLEVGFWTMGLAGETPPCTL